MKLNINGEELELVYSFRSAVYFEQISGHNLDFAKLSPNDTITLFYCVVIASLQKAKKPIITLLDFMDVVDDNGGEKLLIDFANWFIEVLKAQYEVLNSDNTKNEPKKEKKSSKKKKS